MDDFSKFPDPVYKETVLAPLFEGVKSHYMEHMRAINEAHLVMLHETGILNWEEANEIGLMLLRIEVESEPGKLKYTGDYEDYFFYIEGELRRRLGDLGGMLHTARSRNDMDHTIFKMALRSRVDALWQEMSGLAEALLKKAEEERDTLVVAYTHGQPAQPTTFGHYLCAAIEVLLRDLVRLNLAADALEYCPMGAAAITTTGFPIDRARVAELLGFKEPKLNSYGCIASVDYVTGLYSAIKLVFVHLGRLIQDLAFWSSFEVGQLYVPNSFVQISSIMPQKRNPVPIEHMRHLASVTAGRCDMMVDTMRNTPFTDMNDSEGEVQQAGYAVFDSAGRTLRLLTAFLPACQINSDRVRINAEAACVTITELADTLVRKEKVRFRDAHEVASATARAVLDEGVPVGQGYAHFKTAFHEVVGRAPRLKKKDFEEAVSLENFVACRDRPGGPAPGALQSALETYSETLARLQTYRQTRVERHERGTEALADALLPILEI